jgi:hypothetical protein
LPGERRGGSTILTINTFDRSSPSAVETNLAAENDASAERIASILDNCGVVDIEEEADRDLKEGRPVFGSETDSSRLK